MQSLARAVSRAMLAVLGGLSGRGALAALGVAFVAVVVLGTIGFTRYQEAAAGSLEPLASRIYASLQLFVMEGGGVAGFVPWELQVARYAAPLVAAYAILQALAAVFRDQLDALRLGFIRDHVVVAGLGRKGALLVEGLMRDGRRVVAVDIDPENAELGWVRRNGGLALAADARSSDTLARARVARASNLAILCGDDMTNAEIYARAREDVVRRPSGTLHCVVHLVNAELCLLLEGEELERYRRAPIHGDFVNVHAIGAGAVLRAYPPFPPDVTAPPRIVVVGAGLTARHLLVALARAWATADGSAKRRMPVTVVGAPETLLRDLAQRHAEIGRSLDLRAAATVPDVSLEPAPDVVYVAPDDDSAAATCGLELRTLLTGHPTRIVVILEQRSGLGHLLEGAPEPVGGPAMVTFGMLDEACQPELLLTGTTELIAQALHGAYLATRDGTDVKADPSARPWAELPEALRESNRDQAAHVAVKLAAIDRTIGPLVDWDGARRPFAAAELETMARLEHDRWMAERLRNGWRPGPRDARRQTTPYLVPWDELVEPIRDTDRAFIRQLPAVLASVGLQARRAHEVAQPEKTEIAEEAAHAPEARRGGRDDRYGRRAASGQRAG